ncbi:MAG: hypothetical protein U9N76_00555 [Candidatus Marinimicrobia bacterium]|nr:hypothetical protein [Candidatus Neomarinimicrobiota bacterium]
MKKNVLQIMLMMICLLTAFIRAEAKTKKDRSFGLSASIQDSQTLPTLSASRLNLLLFS